MRMSEFQADGRLGSLRVSKLTSLVFGSLQAKIIAVILCAVLVTTASVAAFAFHVERYIEGQIVESHEAVAETYVGLVDEYLAGAQSATDSLARQALVSAPIDVALIDPKI